MNFDLLYLGFEGEYHVAGCLFGAGLEAFKSPADFGYDLIVTNQKETSFGGKVPQRATPFPYAVQVKSRRIDHDKFQLNSNGRPQAQIEFQIKPTDVKRIQSDQNGFLVLVVFVRGLPGRLGRNAFHLWLDGSHLTQLLEHNFLVLRDDAYFVKLEIRLFPKLDTKPLLQELVKGSMLTAAGQQRLSRELPAQVDRAWNAGEYLSLVRPSKTDPTKEVAKSVPGSLGDFHLLGSTVSLASLF